MASPFTSTSAPAGPMGGATAPLPDPGGARADRVLGRRPSLPGGRALVGAALVVAAAVMTYAAYLNATAKPTQSFVVAKGELRVNDVVSADDFTVVTGDLPAEVGTKVFRSPAELDGARMLAPVGAGALVNRSAVLTRDRLSTAPDSYEVSFTVANWKLGGGNRLQANELINLVPTGDPREQNRPLPPEVRDVRVISLTAAGAGGIGSGSNDSVVTVAASDANAYQAIVNVVRGEFWVVRSTRVAGTGPSGAVAPPTGATGPSTTMTFSMPSVPLTPGAPSGGAATGGYSSTTRRP
jgi:hypothetical protein